MDGYISKPIRADVLKAELDKFADNSPEPRVPSGSAVGQTSLKEEGAFSLNTLLNRVDQDRELLKELVEIFKHEFPRYRDELRQAVAQSDLQRVSTVGHALKGMFANLAADRAAALAANLERIGKGTETAGLQAALEAFEAESAVLLPALDSSLAEVCR